MDISRPLRRAAATALGGGLALALLPVVVAAAPPTTAPPTTAPPLPAPEELAASLSEGGAGWLAAADPATMPRYTMTVTIDPVSGAVSGHAVAELPVGAADVVHLRWFPAIAAEDAEVRVTALDGEAVAPERVELAGSLVTVSGVDGGDDGRVVVETEFGFVAPDFHPEPPGLVPSGDALQPTDIGLLARTDGTVTLGHWFPTWLPADVVAEPELDGYGDIANFPAALISATIDAGSDAVVTTGGVRLGEEGGRVVEGGAGLRDLIISVFTDPEQVTTTAADGTEVVVTAPAATAGLADVAAEVAAAVDALAAAFGPYPWTELDVQAVPLGSGVGGMEWPGMVWIESTIFAGGLPGLGDLGSVDDLLGGGGAGGASGDPAVDLSVLEDLGLDELLGTSMSDLLLSVETVRPWTVAHEVGHMWWHALVGNDSLAAPAIDEPLAQHSACVVMRAVRPDDADAVCAAQTAATFSQLTTMMGVADAPADQASDAFDSSLQYGAVVYGKAPGLYTALEETYGADAVQAALAGVVDRFAFGQLDTDELRVTLGEELGDRAGVDALWAHWMDETHGLD